MNESKKTTKNKDTQLVDDESGEEDKSSIIIKKKSKKLKVIFIVFAILLIIPLLILGWLGFVPGLSNVMGARTAKDLGVTWTEADFESYQSKTQTTFYDSSEAPTSSSGGREIFTDPVSTSGLVLTQEEITAAINSLGWSWLPASNVQVRLSDNLIEVSGNIKLDHIEDFISFIGGVGYSDEDVSEAAAWGRRLVSGGAFYAKGDASVSNNELSFSLEEIKIGRFSVPMDVASRVISTGTSNGINRTPYLDIKTATVSEGALNFSGGYPSTIYVLR